MEQKKTERGDMSSGHQPGAATVTSEHWAGASLPPFPGAHLTFEFTLLPTVATVLSAQFQLVLKQL